MVQLCAQVCCYLLEAHPQHLLQPQAIRGSAAYWHDVWMPKLLLARGLLRLEGCPDLLGLAQSQERQAWLSLQISSILFVCNVP